MGFIEETLPKETLFKSAEETKRGLKIAIYGPFSTGKTHFALTGKEPVYIIDTEMGSAPIMKSIHFKNKNTKILEVLEVSEDVLERDDVKSYEKIKEAIEYLYKNVHEGTLVVDSITDIWKIVQGYSKVNLLKIKAEDRPKYQFDWGLINNVYRQMLLKLIALPVDVIITSRTSVDYDGNGNKLNSESPQWQKDTPYMVDIVIESVKTFNKMDGPGFEYEIKKARGYDKKIIGKKFKELNIEQLKKVLNGEI